MAADPLWETLTTICLWRSQWYNLRQDRIRLPTGEEITYTYQDHPGAVFVVPFTSDGRVVLIRQYRHPIREWLWEVPAGAVEAPETPVEAAWRELAEEIGGTANEMQLVGDFFAASSVSNLRIYVFLAADVVLDVPTNREATELIEIALFPVEEALAMARSGVIRDGQSALALLWCEPLWAHL